MFSGARWYNSKRLLRRTPHFKAHWSSEWTHKLRFENPHSDGSSRIVSMCLWLFKPRCLLVRNEFNFVLWADEIKFLIYKPWGIESLAASKIIIKIRPVETKTFGPNGTKRYLQLQHHWLWSQLCWKQSLQTFCCSMQFVLQDLEPCFRQPLYL